MLDKIADFLDKIADFLDKMASPAQKMWGGLSMEWSPERSPFLLMNKYHNEKTRVGSGDATEITNPNNAKKKYFCL